MIDGQPLARFGYQNYRKQIGAVAQDDNLFAGTLADNIALFDEAPDMERIIASATAAAIHDDIAKMPMHYETLAGDMGSTLSGGQKQRVLMARALYRQPRLLVIDEGTSHLDAKHEAAVNEAVSQLGITRIIVAHRQETIASAKQVYSLESKVLQDIRLTDTMPPKMGKPILCHATGTTMLALPEIRSLSIFDTSLRNKALISLKILSPRN